MKIISFGSLNIDHVYAVDHITQPGESNPAAGLSLHAGGKGLNQSVAAARAGATVVHAGAVGPEGDFLLQLLADSGADASHVLRLDQPTGHAIIQVDKGGQNAIVVYAGANFGLTDAYIDEMLSLGEPGDIVLLQNETNSVPEIMQKAAARGLTVAFNPSPLPRDAGSLPLDAAGVLIVNEIEGAFFAGLPEDAPEEDVLAALQKRAPKALIVLTLGSRGALCTDGKTVARHPIFPVKAADTTGAGDTFCGYFLSGLCRGLSPADCLRLASAASAIAVTRPGAAGAVPTLGEVEAFLKEHES